MKKILIALALLVATSAAAQTPLPTKEALRAQCVDVQRKVLDDVAKLKSRALNKTRETELRKCASLVDIFTVVAPAPDPVPTPAPAPVPLPPAPTAAAFAFIKPFAGLAAGQSVAIPNTRMAPCIVNDLSDLMRATSGSRAIFTDWASTALIRSTGRLVYWGGGHAATHDASVYERDLMTGQCRRAWRTYDMGDPRPGYPIGVMFERDGVTVQAPEKAPRSSHAYAGLLPIPGRDAVYVFHTDSLQPVKPIAAWTGPWADWEFDFARLARGENPWKALPGAPMFNPPTGVVLRPDGKAVVHANYDYVKDLATGAVRTIWRNFGSSNEGAACYDGVRDASIVAALNQGVYRIDHKGGAMSPDWTRLHAWAELGAIGARGAPGIVCQPHGRDLIVYWDGRREFAWAAPGGALTRWTVPGAAPANGPWSVNHKIHALPELGADLFLLVGGPDDDLTLIRLPFDGVVAAPAPMPPPPPAPGASGVVTIAPADNVQAKFDLSAASPVSADGKRVIKIGAGVYEQAAILKGADTRVECAAGAIFRDKIAESKAAVVVKADRAEWIGCRFEHPSINFETVANAAAFRLEAKDFTLRGAYIRDYQMGVLGGTIYGWKTKRLQTDRGYVHIFDTTIEDIGKTTFDYNKTQPNPDLRIYPNLSHLIYVAAYDECRVERSTFRRSWEGGHLIKSRCRNTVVADSVLDQGDAPGSLAVDIPNGGAATIKNTAIVHGARSDNADVIGFAKEYWGDLPPATVTDHEYSGLASNLEKLWPGVSALVVDGVTIRTEVAEVPHWEQAVWGVRAPNLAEISIALKGLAMTRLHPVPVQFSMRPFDDRGGNVK